MSKGYNYLLLQTRVFKKRQLLMQPNRINCIIFDLDGTLLYTYRTITDAFNYTMNRFGLPVKSVDFIRRSVGKGLDGLLVPLVGEELFPEISKVFCEKQRESLFEGTYPLPGAEEALNHFQTANCRMAVASNKPAEFVVPLLEHFQMAPFFQVVLGGDNVARKKPHPEMLFLIMEKLRVKPERALYVGDMTLDVEAGRRAGIKTIAVLTGSSAREELEREKPFKILETLHHLPETVSTLF